jgi:hypothetical protein
MRAKVAACVAASALLGALLPMTGAGADSHTVYTVVAGASLNDKGEKQVSHRFFPGDITLHQGDVLDFGASGKRSIALLPVGYEPAEWFAEFSTPEGAPWAALVPDTDEGAGASKLNTKVGFATDPNCGTEAGPCVFDGTGNGEDGVLSSGLPIMTPLDWHIDVQVAPGDSFWIVDLMTPTMAMEVTVVADEVAASDPVALAAAAAQQFEEDEATATSVHQQYATKKVSKTKNGKTTWTAWAGVDEGAVSLRYMYPLKLTIKKNQLVRWKFTELQHGVRTVTFPKTRSAQLSNSYPQIVCDLDDEGTAADSDPQIGTAPFCTDPRDVELDVSSEILSQAGDGLYTAGTDFESSGVRGAGYASDVRDYVLKFTKTSPKKGFKYASIVHMYATGTVVVKS